jgi:TPR repeat protein
MRKCSAFAEVLGLCEKAAPGHYAPEAVGMGELYLGGLGIDQNFPMAAKWFGEAASSGNAIA